MKPKLALAKVPSSQSPRSSQKGLLMDVRKIILSAREAVAQRVNSTLVLLYWEIGSRVRKDILNEKRAGYGEQILHALSAKLAAEFGRGFTERNLFNMVKFAEAFSDPQVIHALSGQLSWTHLRRLIYLDDPLKRDFYAEMCRIERWSSRTLDRKIQSMLFERTALSKKPAELAAMELRRLRREDELTPDLVFRDPYLLDFLGLQDTFDEKDVEAAILREMEAFILELGVGFCFAARQKRMQIDGRDYYLDLLFYHRKLKRLVAVDLKIGDFEAGDKGQMELYLSWLKRHECEPGEAEPLGLILCAGKTAEHVELLESEKSGIHIAAYLTTALPKKELERKLHQAVRLARVRLAEAAEPPTVKPSPNQHLACQIARRSRGKHVARP
jgi:predicted nuclease of restriction endonuclease-like (RecB) superfamily